MTSAPTPASTDPLVRVHDDAVLSVAPDGRVRVFTEGAWAWLEEWVLLGALGAPPAWFEDATRLQRAAAVPDADHAAMLAVLVAPLDERRELAAPDGVHRSTVLALLATDPDLSVRARAAQALGDEPWAQALLADLSTQGPVVRCAVAENPHTPERLLLALAADPDDWVRATVADREAPLPISVLGVLARDEDDEVRMSVAGRSDLPETILGALAIDRRPTVREAVARKATCPPGILANLVVDPDPLVRAQALRVIKEHHAPRARLSSRDGSGGTSRLGGAAGLPG